MFANILALSSLWSAVSGQNLTGSSSVTVTSVQTKNGSLVAPTGAGILTVGVVGGKHSILGCKIRIPHWPMIDYGWIGWVPGPYNFCNNVLPKLQALNLSVPNELVNDCDPGDRSYDINATALQSKLIRPLLGSKLTFHSGHSSIHWTNLHNEELQCFCEYFWVVLAERRSWSISRSQLEITFTIPVLVLQQLELTDSRKLGWTCIAKEFSNMPLGTSA